MTASWFSQPFPPEGASTAEGIRNQLGRPVLDLLTILVRETAQNSWDARLPHGTDPVDYEIDMWTMGPAHAPAWRELLTRNAPMNDHLPIRESLTGSIRVMAVSDRGTSGLGGPTRADDVSTRGHDFVSFVRNVGEPRDTELGGGTYGFGKGIFYLISKPGTVVLYTRCVVDGRYETRLMGCALWSSYVAIGQGGQTRYTGRHWWGDNSGGVVEPLIDAEADAIASRLGLRPFGAGETGTTIVIVDPILDGRDLADAASYVAETIAWHLWPKMLETSTGVPSMSFSVTCDGISYPVPDPRETWPLRLFVAAYEAMDGPAANTMWCYRPKKDLGLLGLVKRTAPAVEPTDAARMVGLAHNVHHVCLMRQAELVVTYRPGPKPATEYQHYAGVFRANRDLDQTYAKAEPPTHDAWNPQSLDGWDSRYVNTTFKRIDEALESFVDFGGGIRGATAKVALGAASTMFSPLVSSAWGTGGATDYAKPGSTLTRTDGRTAESTAPGSDAAGSSSGAPAVQPEHSGWSSAGGWNSANGQGSAGATQSDDDRRPSGLPVGRPVHRARARVEYVGEPYYAERSGEPVLIQDFRLPVPGPQRVRGDLGVALATSGGRETDPPLGAEMPGLIGWEDATGSLHTEPSLLTDGGTDAVWRLIVHPALDTMTEIDIRTEGVESK